MECLLLDRLDAHVAEVRGVPDRRQRPHDIAEVLLDADLGPLTQRRAAFARVDRLPDRDDVEVPSPSFPLSSSSMLALMSRSERSNVIDIVSLHGLLAAGHGELRRLDHVNDQWIARECGHHGLRRTARRCPRWATVSESGAPWQATDGAAAPVQARTAHAIVARRARRDRSVLGRSIGASMERP